MLAVFETCSASFCVKVAGCARLLVLDCDFLFEFVSVMGTLSCRSSVAGSRAQILLVRWSHNARKLFGSHS